MAYFSPPSLLLFLFLLLKPLYLLLGQPDHFPDVFLVFIGEVLELLHHALEQISVVDSKLFKELIPKQSQQQGMGIGGLLAATIVEDHEGTIELEHSSPGSTTVLVRLPLGGKQVS